MTGGSDPRTIRQLPPALQSADHLRWFVGIEDTCVYPRAADTFAALDEHVLTGHSTAWRDDIDRVAGLGVDGLRYGMSWPTVHVGPGRFDWDGLDPILAQLHDRNLHVIADLVHYGCPPWLEGSFVDEAFVPALTEFALALVDRYGDAIGSLTPINEPLTTASFCGLRAVWPPAIGSQSGWARVAVMLAEASQSVIRHVRAASPDTPIVTVEAGHVFETDDPTLVDHVAELEMLGDLATDLITGTRDPQGNAVAWLLQHGIDEGRLQRLVDEAELPDVFGINYYPDLTPRVLLNQNGRIRQLTVDRWATGLSRVVRHAADRYGLPVLVTETSVEGPEAHRAAWLDAAVAELHELRVDGVDVRGITWWPLLDFVDWSYIADGANVEEFDTGAVDPVTNELVAVPITARNRAHGLRGFARRMGLFTLGDGGRRDPTVVATQFAELVGGGAGGSCRPTEPAGRLGTHETPSVEIQRGWTLTPANGREHTAMVPGLWEADGHVDLDGTARYRATFEVDDPDRYWTLRFGAVMDRARVELNGVELGTNHLPYTPFEFDISGNVVHTNILTVDVTDPPAGTAEHLSSAHGKQGWANHEFPSPPSLYLAYGGIWQPVTVRSHGEVVIRDVRCNLDPHDTVVTIEFDRLGTAPSVPGAANPPSQQEVLVEVIVDFGGHVRSATRRMGHGRCEVVGIGFGATGLGQWSPECPTLHACAVSVSIGGVASDKTVIAVGLRTVAIERGQLVVNGVPTPMRSALVQGFHAEALYAEGSEADIEHEIGMAQDLGFNMLRLHLRPFDPRYLAACDRMGMLLHCDASIAEPIQHDQIDDVGPVARRCAAALAAQVRRDRSHPSIVLWSVMNEIGIDRPTLRGTDRYKRFVRHMVDTLLSHDATRPYIENDWIDPDSSRVFHAPIATAHWYGHLDRDYLCTLERRCVHAGADRLPVAVTEFGDWGLSRPDVGDGRFYEHRRAYEAMLADTWWPGTLAEFSASTQGYQGISDRLQIDIIRRTGTTAGYCLTELTDVPWEFNGILDVDRNPKPAACRHITIANRMVSPVLALDEFGAAVGRPFLAAAWIVNDSEVDVRVEATVSHDGGHVDLGTRHVPAHSVGELPLARLTIASGAGPSEVEITATEVDRKRVWTSTYPIVVHGEGPARPIAVRLVDSTAAQLVAATPWLTAGTGDVLLVGEGALADAWGDLNRHLQRKGVAVVLAQAVGPYPGAHGLASIRTEWGGTPFRYTTDEPVVRAFPARTVLHVHDADIAPDAIVVPAAPVAHAAVGLFKPPPRPANGLVLGALSTGGGVVVVCQYRLHDDALAGRVTAQGVLGDVLTWAQRLVNHVR